MLKYIYSISVAVLLALCTTSCIKEGVGTDVQETGYLYVSLKQDVTVDPVFKSTASEDMIFSLVIYDSDENIIAAYQDHNELAASPLEVPVGYYRVVASSSPVGTAAFDAPFYSGETTIAVRGNQVTTATVVCTLANVKVTAEMSEQMLLLFSEYVLTVSNGVGTLVYSSLDGTFSKEGYFTATDHLTWTLSLTNTDGTRYGDITETYTDIKPCQHYNLKFSLGERDEFGGSDVSVSINGETTDKTYDLLLDFEAGIRPAVSASFDMNKVIKFVEGQPAEAKFYIDIPGGAKYVQLSHANSDLSNNSLPYNFKMMNMTASDRTWYALRGILVSEILDGARSATLDLSGLVSKLPIGVYRIEFYIEAHDGRTRTQYCNFEVVSAADVEAVSATPWACLAFLSGKWYPEEQPDAVSFQYRKQTASDWVEVAADKVVSDPLTKTFTAEVWGLEPSTTYVFRAVSSKEKETKERTFVTESAGTIPNMGFDAWYQSDGVWYPNPDSGNFWWDTANGGSKAVNVFPTSPEYNHKIGGDAAAKLESKSVALVGLAAGNIYTGRFVKAITSLTDPGAELDWGVSYTSRPLALKGYVDYTPGTVNQTNAPYNNMSGKPDIASVQVFITDWSAPFRISTASGKFVDTANDSGIIAYGIMDFNQTNGYIEFTIPLTYRSTTRQPRYIVIAASASKYGDYFTGSTSSVMYVDEFSFVYEPSQLTEEQLAKVKYK
ncbi:MAG: PCMD domain-containing protein [Bacteroidales bacterium]|nr:PCMD domain-containing protein [Bacteroidales bacterium]MBR5862905.1 PCMD domain-containing protein [Bacteroidales bacterium]